MNSSPFDQPVGVSQKNPLEQIVVRLEVALRLTFAMPATAAEQVVAQPRDLACTGGIDAAIP